MHCAQLRGLLKNSMPTLAIHMGECHMVYNRGRCEVGVSMGLQSIPDRFYVKIAKPLTSYQEPTSQLSRYKSFPQRCKRPMFPISDHG